MGDQNVSKVEPVDFNSSNGGSSSTTPKQTFGKCKRCQKNEIKTMHVQCHHLTCCFTCAKNCKECPQCGLPSNEEKNKHLAIYASKTDKVDEEHTYGQPTDTGPAYRLENEDTHNLILDYPTTTDAAVQNDDRDEPYDPNATQTLGTCPICLAVKATCFIESQGKTKDELVCGHDVCIDCVIKPELVRCPQCRREIISYLEVRDFEVNE